MSTILSGVESPSLSSANAVPTAENGLTGAKTAGELAGRFAILLQDMNDDAEPSASGAGVSGHPQKPGIPSAGGDAAVDVRWATKLFADTTESSAR